MGLLLALAPNVGLTQPNTGPRPAANAVWAEQAPTIDGVISEALWSAAPRHGGFSERKPQLRQDPPEATWFWAAYDLDNLYIAVLAHDADPPIGRSRAPRQFCYLSGRCDQHQDRR